MIPCVSNVVVVNVVVLLSTLALFIEGWQTSPTQSTMKRLSEGVNLC